MLLSRLNEFFKGWISVVIISIVSLTFVLWGLQSYVHNLTHSDKVASVDSIEITKSELHRAFERNRMQIEQVSGKPIVDEQEIQKIRDQTLEAIITRLALKQSATDMGIYVSDHQAQATVISIPAFQVNGKFSAERLDHVLSTMQYTQPEFIRDVQADISLNQFRSGVVLSAFATPQELTQTMRLLDQKREFDYLIIDAARFASDVNVTPAEVKAYYDHHLDEFKTPEEVKIAYLSLSLPNLVNSVQVSEQEIENYYENNHSNYVVPATWRIAHINIKVPENPTKEQLNNAKERMDKIAQNIKAGADFAKEAMQSDDPITKKQGGEMPPLTLGTTDPSFEVLFKDLTKPGAISKPMQTKYGFEIVKLIKYTPMAEKPLALVKDQITQNIKQEKAQKQFGDLREELADLTFSNPTTLDEASKALKLPIQTTDYFSKKNHGTGITAQLGVLNAAFSDDVKEQANNSDVIQLSESEVIVLRVLEKKPSAQKTVAQVTDMIRTKLLNEKQLKAAEAFATQLTQVSNESEAKQMLAKRQLQWQTSGPVLRRDHNLDPAIMLTAFTLPNRIGQKASQKVITLNNQKVAIVKLERVLAAELTTLPQQQKSILTEQIANTSGAFAYELYKDSVLKKSEIKHFKVAASAESQPEPIDD